jgi:hypothetical protein
MDTTWLEAGVVVLEHPIFNIHTKFGLSFHIKIGQNLCKAGSQKLQIWLKCGFSGRLILDTCKIAVVGPKN